MDGRLQDRVAVITGGGSGIGTATARLFAAQGARLALVDRDEDAADAMAEELCQSGAEAMALAGDVGNETEVDTHRDAIMARFGTIDILLASAGWSTGTSVPDTSAEMWNAVINTNLTGSFLWSRAVLDPMRKAGRGSIVLVGSQLAMAGGKANAAYLASKGAIVSLTQTMAVDHAAEGIRVNAVIPGAIDTPLLRRAFDRAQNPQAAREASTARHPLGRLGTAEDVARGVLFLASDDAAFTTGSCLRVDGGWLAA